jgi:hypothetical protein
MNCRVAKLVLVIFSEHFYKVSKIFSLLIIR